MYPFISSYQLSLVLMKTHCVVPKPVYVSCIYYYNYAIELKII